jgi:hypothetical protein
MKKTKIVTKINGGLLFKSESDWDSHKPLLGFAIYKERESLPIIEFGCGKGSTPFISQAISDVDNVQFLTVDNNIEYLELIKDDVSGVGIAVLVNNYLDFQIINQIGLLFIDCAPGEIRKDLIKKYELQANVIIVHDTELGAEYVYGMNEVLSSFKYRLDYQPEGKPHTTAVSNYIDVTSWC